MDNNKFTGQQVIVGPVGHGKSISISELLAQFQPGGQGSDVTLVSQDPDTTETPPTTRP